MPIASGSSNSRAHAGVEEAPELVSHALCQPTLSLTLIIHSNRQPKHEYQMRMETLRKKAKEILEEYAELQKVYKVDPETVDRVETLARELHMNE
jgi:hypothetical protein